MPESSWALLALACVMVLAAVAWFVFARMNDGGDPEMRRLMTRLDAMDQARMQTQAPTQEAAPGAAIARPQGDEPREQGDAQVRERLDRLETAFSRDAAGPGSDAVERRLRDVAADKRLLASGIASEGVEVKCRVRMCRVVADFRDADDASDWAALYTALLGTTPVSGSQAVFVRNAGGGTQLRLFADRGRTGVR